jgi:hypothetical protein
LGRAFRITGMSIGPLLYAPAYLLGRQLMRGNPGKRGCAPSKLGGSARVYHHSSAA